jgi:mRNA interferase MazF
VRRGDVFWAELAPRTGSEQRGRRPVIVLSHDAFNETASWQSVIVIPCSTSGAQRRRGPTAVFLIAGTAGLPEDSIALCHQITTLDRSKLAQRIGALTEPSLRAVEEGLRAAVGLA